MSLFSPRALIRPLQRHLSARRCLSNDVHVTRTSSAPHTIVHRDEDDATSLVDNLLIRTQELMRGSSHHVVAYSGGVDSSLVAALLKQLERPSHTVQAVLGLSPAVPNEQVQLARRVAAHLQMDLVEVATEEQSSDTYIANQGKACLACKTHLYSALQSVVQHTALNSSEAHLYNGTNADDTRDTTRLGLIAADQFSVKSPLLFVGKQEVRRAAKWLGLPNHDTAAAPCLRSRLALGVEATKHHLEMIAKAERHVRLLLNLNHKSNLRVRMLAGNKSMIEVDPPHVQTAEELLEELTPYFVSLGFESVQVRPFKSGSVARPTTTTTTTMDYVEPMVATG